MTQDIWLFRYNNGLPLDRAVPVHIAAYQERHGRPPVEILAHVSVVDEIRQVTDLRVTGTKSVQPHEMMLRH